MPDDDDIALSEKRMYGERRRETRCYVATAMGVAYVAVSDDQIGRFGLAHRCTARDVAAGDGRLFVATEEDVLIDEDPREDGGTVEPTGFGPAVAVGGGEEPLAASPDGRVAALEDDEWRDLDAVPEVRAVDGDLVATADGVYRRDGDGLAHVGLEDVRDVAAAGRYAATDSGVFRERDGWEREVSGSATVVASDGDRAHAVGGGDLLERVDGAWEPAGAPREGVVDVAYDEAAFAVTADGTVLVDPVSAKDGAPEWRTRSLGLADAVALAIP